MKLYFFGVNVPLLLLLLCLIVSHRAQAEWFEYNAEVMTTKLELQLSSGDKNKAEEIFSEIVHEFDRIESSMSSYIETSELSRVNREAFDRPVKVSKELFSLLWRAKDYSRLSGGAFDITFGSLGYLYDFQNQLEPSAAEISEKLPLINYRLLVLDPENDSIRFQSKGVKLDLGGIAKGYAVDRAVKILKRHNVTNAHIRAGGDAFFLGDKDGRPWVVAVQHPREPEKNAVVLPVQNEAMSTSGDYQRYFINQQGERVSHILSPKTGKPANGLRSVTVLGQDVTETDALSTAIFVLGLRKGLELVNRLPNIEAIIIGGSNKIYFSNGLMR